MKTKNHIKRQALKDGLDLVNNQHVLQCQVSDDFIIASVQDQSSTYNVLLHVKDNLIDMHQCSCAEHDQFGCKHVTAAIYYAFEDEIEKMDADNELSDEILETLTHEEAFYFLMEQLDLDEELKQRFIDRFSFHLEEEFDQLSFLISELEEVFLRNNQFIHDFNQQNYDDTFFEFLQELDENLENLSLKNVLLALKKMFDLLIRMLQVTNSPVVNDYIHFLVDRIIELSNANDEQILEDAFLWVSMPIVNLKYESLYILDVYNDGFLDDRFIDLKYNIIKFAFDTLEEVPTIINQILIPKFAETYIEVAYFQYNKTKEVDYILKKYKDFPTIILLQARIYHHENKIKQSIDLLESKRFSFQEEHFYRIAVEVLEFLYKKSNDKVNLKRIKLEQEIEDANDFSLDYRLFREKIGEKKWPEIYTFAIEHLKKRKIPRYEFFYQQQEVEELKNEILNYNHIDMIGSYLESFKKLPKNEFQKLIETAIDNKMSEGSTVSIYNQVIQYLDALNDTIDDEKTISSIVKKLLEKYPKRTKFFTMVNEHFNKKIV